jgi:CDP-diacylglycerol--serine O-phosphatidyltransferase
MLFDALDGRLARFTRHTTDFGGQLDSLADAISFGVAPAFLAMNLFREVMLFREMHLHAFVPVIVSRLVWAIGALYVSCAVVRLARFNVSNKHGEQHHFSFEGLPSPGAAAAVVGFILMQQEVKTYHVVAGRACVFVLPAIVLITGLLMVSTVRYPHLVNKYLRGKRSFNLLIAMVILGLAVIVAWQYVLAAGTLIYALWGPIVSGYLHFRPRPAAALSAPPQTGTTP